MKKKLYLLAVIVGLASLSCGSNKTLEGITAPTDRAAVMRGQSLVRGLAACGFCHGETADPRTPMSGGRPIYDAHGEVLAPNITPHQTGIADWSALEVVNALRYGIDKDKEQRAYEVHKGFTWMSNPDALAVVAYLETLPPMNNEVPKRALGFIDRNTTGLLLSTPSDVGYVPPIDPKFEREYGGYLTDHVARCVYCHNSPSGLFKAEEYLTGGAPVRTDKGTKVAPGITNSDTAGLGSWSADDIVQYLRTGRTPQGQSSDPDFCPTGFYRNAEERDLRAIATYLKSLQKG
jgi:hypothetical protein